MKIGLKVWASNPIAHVKAAEKLAQDGLCDYIEIYVGNNMTDYIERWHDLPLAKVIHAPHLAHKFNFADCNLRAYNAKIFSEVQMFADRLESSMIICHGGTGGSVEESIFQIANTHDKRIVLENKPFWQHPDFMPEGDQHCRGAVFTEFQTMVNELNCRTCHDVTHTVCMANSLHLPWEEEIRKFESFKPVIHHLSDLISADDELDSHTALDRGKLDWRAILKMLPPEAMLTLETPKASQEHLDDFAHEAELLKEAGF